MPALLEGWRAQTTTAPRTLKHMREQTREALHHQSVIEAARNIVGRVAPRDEVGQARAIRSWSLEHFHFIKDPVGDENLTGPRYLLRRIHEQGFVQGDCDDAAQLTGALLTAVGIPARFIAAAFAPHGSFRHVFTIGYPLDRATGRRTPLEMDITRPSGMALPKFARTLAQPV